MARALAMNDVSWAGIGAAIGAFLTGLFAWLVQRSKGGTDIEVAVLAEWQKLNAALSRRVSDVEREMAELRRAHSAEIEEIRSQHRDQMTAQLAVNEELRSQNDALRRAIIQNSRSEAQLLGGSPVTRAKGDSDGK